MHPLACVGACGAALPWITSGPNPDPNPTLMPRVSWQASLLAPPAVQLFQATDEERDNLKHEIAGLRVLVDRQAAIMRQHEALLTEEKDRTVEVEDSAQRTTESTIEELRSQVKLLQIERLQLQSSLHAATMSLESQKADFEERLEARTHDVERRYTHMERSTALT